MGAAKGAALLEASGGDPSRLDAADWDRLLGCGAALARRKRDRALSFDPDAEAARCGKLGARLLFREDEEYPDLLRSIPDPPPVLYALGRLEARPALAVVGAREPTPYGVRMARRLAGEAAARGLAVASGMARGVDGEAHRAALDSRGATWAVLGTGVNRPYPSENAELARRIAADGGCVLSELPLDAAPLAEHFPRRNRIVSGLAWGVLVVEGRRKSGSLLTARQGLEQGREVFAVPGPADSPLSEAPNLLLGEGAHVACAIEDVLRHLPPGVQLAGAEPVVRPASPRLSLEEPERRILSLLGSHSLSLDELAAAAGLDTPAISSIMFGLESKNLVTPLPGQRYAQKAL